MKEMLLVRGPRSVVCGRAGWAIGPRAVVDSPDNRGQRTADNGQRTKSHAQAFTLLELMMVMALMLILVSFAVPAYHTAVQRAREAVLRDDLTTLRRLIDEFTVDKQRPPESLQELVDAGYMRGIPVDPMTGSADSWKVDVDEVATGADQTASGVVDVHSGSDGTALDGTPYNSW